MSLASLVVEPPASVTAVDALEFPNLFHVRLFPPSVSRQNDQVIGLIGESLVITEEARNMCVSHGQTSANKRTCIGVNKHS